MAAEPLPASWGGPAIESPTGAPRVLFGDAESAVIVYLKDRIPNLKAGREIPHGWRPDDGPFVRVGRIGGWHPSPVTDLAHLDVEVYSNDRIVAHDLMQLCLAELMRVDTMPQNTERAHMYRVSVQTGPQFLADPVTHDPRWITTVEVVLRGAATAK